MNFCTKLLSFYEENKRDLIWRKTSEPYKIWLSEIILQQTQISQGTAYYLKFIETYPTVFDLAKAEEQDILLLWQGLGYYSRARNLLHTAKEIVRIYKGKFPDNFNDLIKLKGIGEYTASAILSICFKKVYPAVDGNVLRIISRIFGIREPINQASGKKQVTEKCKTLICKENPGDFNQALMDFGSSVCKKSNPNCANCIFNNACEAYQHDIVSELPVKTNTKAKITEYFNYFILAGADEILIQKRTSGIWKNLYEFPLIVSGKRISVKTVKAQFKELYSLPDECKFTSVSEPVKHVLSHKTLFVRFYFLQELSEKQFLKIRDSGNFLKIKQKNLSDYPFPQIIRNFSTVYRFTIP